MVFFLAFQAMFTSACGALTASFKYDALGSVIGLADDTGTM